MLVGKWNYNTKEYDDYELPEGAISFSPDMDKIINCADCGKKVVYGESYGSQEIHTTIGMAYMVCEDCYFTDRERGN